MSLLAEKKRKTKWCLNPNGNLWAKDNNKFGQKMLEKMGWSPGKGLGAREQGIPTALRPKVNTTGRGLGYSVKDDFWMEHQEEFSALLSELNQGQGVDIKNTSLEERSKFSRGRVHYKKFTRGKDVSRYSMKELSAIIGRAAAVQDSGSLAETYFDMKLTEMDMMEEKIGLNLGGGAGGRLMDGEQVLEEDDSFTINQSNNKLVSVKGDSLGNTRSNKKRKKKNKSSVDKICVDTEDCGLPGEEDGGGGPGVLGSSLERHSSQLKITPKRNKKRRKEIQQSESSPAKKKCKQRRK